MIIRTQDKKSIINFANVDVIYISKINGVSTIIAGFVSGENSSIDIGKYKSEETAIKVLDEVIELYEQFKMIGGGRSAITGDTIQPQFFIQPKVYQMPSEESE